MKKMKKIYWMLFIILCAACNDPYDGDTYVVFDMQPAGTYLSNRSDDFSEWIHIMKYADLYNAVNQATQSFTLFVPNNADVKEFFATYVTDKDVRRAIEDRKFQLLGTDISTYTMADLKELGLDSMQSVVDYVADNVNVSRFM